MKRPWSVNFCFQFKGILADSQPVLIANGELIVRHDIAKIEEMTTQFGEKRWFLWTVAGGAYLMEGIYVTRFFFAAVPPEPARSTIESFRRRWGNPHHKVEPHITVKVPFYWAGPPESFLAPARAACAGVSMFEARLGAPARFGADVLYLTVAGAGLAHLHRAVCAALAPMLAANPRAHEGEAYAAHLTLASTRFGIGPDDLSAMERAAADELCGFPPFPVTFVRCYRRQGKDGPWEPLCDLPLNPL